jgi:hypothetical protein
MAVGYMRNSCDAFVKCVRKSVTYGCLAKPLRDRHPCLRLSYVDYCVRCKLSLRLIDAPMQAIYLEKGSGKRRREEV